MKPAKPSPSPPHSLPSPCPSVTIANFNFNSLSHAAALAGSRPCSSVASGLSGTRHIISSSAATAEANSRSARLGLKLERRLAGSCSILLFINPRACNLHARKLCSIEGVYLDIWGNNAFCRSSLRAAFDVLTASRSKRSFCSGPRPARGGRVASTWRHDFRRNGGK